MSQASLMGTCLYLRVCFSCIVVHSLSLAPISLALSLSLCRLRRSEWVRQGVEVRRRAVFGQNADSKDASVPVHGAGFISVKLRG